MKFAMRTTRIIAVGWAVTLTMSVRAAPEPIGTPPAGGGTGPYPAVMLTDNTLAGYTLYRPADLNRIKPARLPLVAWGNGGCANVGDSARNFLMEVASHGYLVIAIGPPRPAESQNGVPPTKPGEHGSTVQSRSAQLLAALDWASAEDVRRGSDYFGRLDTKKTAVMGHSCGGLQALEVSSDPKISTSVILDSGILLDPPPFPMPGVTTNDKSELAKLHAPLLYLIGGPTDIAYANAADDFARIDHVPVFMGNINVGHKGTFAEANGGAFAKVAAAWLQWQLKHDEVAANMFVGARCGLCTDADWTVLKKHID